MTDVGSAIKCIGDLLVDRESILAHVAFFKDDEKDEKVGSDSDAMSEQKTGPRVPPETNPPSKESSSSASKKAITPKLLTLSKENKAHVPEYPQLHRHISTCGGGIFGQFVDDRFATIPIVTCPHGRTSCTSWGFSWDEEEVEPLEALDEHYVLQNAFA